MASRAQVQRQLAIDLVHEFLLRQLAQLIQQRFPFGGDVGGRFVPIKGRRSGVGESFNANDVKAPIAQLKQRAAAMTGQVPLIAGMM